MQQYKPISRVPQSSMTYIKSEKQSFMDSLRGYTGDTGPQGIQGDVGKKGDKGDKGDQGLRGYTGEQGPKGDTGPKGEKGEKGDIGEAGKDGRGIHKMYINAGDLYVIYTDGEKVNIGRVLGDQGPQGVRGRSGGVITRGSESLNIVDTAISETIPVSFNKYIRQTVAGITTTLSTSVTGVKFYIKNASNGSTTINNTIDGYAGVTLAEDESLTLVYNGSGYDIV